jgi:uncharacterized protein
MELHLSHKPRSPIIITGFPGLGLVGSIASEFLINHLKMRKVGKIVLKHTTAMVAVHQQQLVDAVSIYHDEKYNIVVVHALSSPQKQEWELAKEIETLIKMLNAREIVCMEGVAGAGKKDVQTFYFSTVESRKRLLEAAGLRPLEEGVIIGLTAALLSTAPQEVTCLFAETASQLPDSKAAAALIKALDAYVGLQVDYKPLLVEAQKFEDKLRSILIQGQKAQELSEKKWMNYVG